MSDELLPAFHPAYELLIDVDALCEATAGMSAAMIKEIGYLIYLFSELGLPMPLINGIECFQWPE